jgi:putative salt-induced outer membrane protein
MIDAAIATGDQTKVATVIELAKQTNPDEVAEIDALHHAFLAEQQRLAEERAAAQQERVRSAGPIDNWSGKGQIGATRSTGNSSNTGLSVGLELQNEGVDWRHRLKAQADYQRSNGTTSREQFLLAYEPNYRISDHIYAYALGQYERDRFQGFSSRISASGGLGYRALIADDMNLSIKAGPAYRRLDVIDGDNPSRLAALAALDFDWKVSDTIKLSQDASAVPQSDNNSFVSTTAVEAALGSNISARIAYVLEHDTDPPAGALKTDTFTRFTLAYGF